MIISRIIYGNAVGGDESGWRVLNATSGISAQNILLFKELCGSLYENFSKENKKVFFAKYIKRTLFLGMGVSYGKDTSGRPGGWWFFGGIISNSRDGVDIALELSQILFLEYNSWLKEESSLQSIRMDIPTSTSKFLVHEFWGDCFSEAKTCQKLLANNFSRKKSYCFPIRSLVSKFDLCIPGQKAGYMRKSQRKKNLIFILLFLLLLSVISVYFNYVLFSEKKRVEQNLITCEQKLEKKGQEYNKLNELFDELKKKNKDLNSSLAERNEKYAELKKQNEALQEDAPKALKKRNHELELKNQRLEKYISEIKKWINKRPKLPEVKNSHWFRR